jgi:hypothetical protein
MSASSEPRDLEARRSLLYARDPFAPFPEPLERLGLPYCVTGSVAASVCGEPRLTAEIDVVLLLRTGNLAQAPSGIPETEYYVPPEETLLIEIARTTRGAFNLIHHATQFKADIYLAAGDPRHAWALEHRHRFSIDRGEAWIAPPEYVILRKLEFLREGGQDRQVRDIRFMLAATPLDLVFVESEVTRIGLQAQWRQCR